MMGNRPRPAFSVVMPTRDAHSETLATFIILSSRHTQVTAVFSPFLS
jgi:hypothetical protein